MHRKKIKTGKIMLAVLGLFLVAGATGTITAGALTDWTYSLNNRFKDVRIEDQEFDYDGEAKTLSIELPEGASYELKILNENGELVSEAKDIGTYEFIYKVTIEGQTREFKAILTIINPSTLDSQFIENGVKIQKANYFTEGENSVAEIVYSVEPTGVDQTIEIASIEWAPNDQCSTDNDVEYTADGAPTLFVQASVNVSENTIKIVNVGETAFRHEINVTVRSIIDEDVTATIKIGYKRRFTVENQHLSFAQSSLGDFYSGIGDIVINYDDFGAFLSPGQPVPGSLEQTNIKLNPTKTIGVSGGSQVNEIHALAYYDRFVTPAFAQLSNTNYGTTRVWTPSDGFSFSVDDVQYLTFSNYILDNYWNQTTGKQDIVNYILGNVFDREVNQDVNGFRATLLSKFTNSSVGYVLSPFYELFRNAQNPLVSTNTPFVSIPKDLLTVNFGDLGSVPYRELFKEDNEAYLNIWINCGPDQTISLEEDNVLF